jgi:hypothetical protein
MDLTSERIEPTSERDPLFARYQTAWHAYQSLQAGDSSAAMPYTRALTDSANPSVRAAAAELAAARHAWLIDLES